MKETDYGLELLPDLQKSQALLLRKIIDFFKVNDINYFLTGGSVLGSIYYQDFLPYDDDVDLGIPRKDYARLIEILRKESQIFGKDTFSNHYSLDSDFKYPAIKVFNLNYNVTSLLENDNEISHPFIDIAPIDGSPTGFFKKRAFKIKFTLLAKLYAYSMVMINPNKKSKAIYQIQHLIANILALFVKQDKQFFLKKLDNYIAKFDIDSSERSGTLLGRYGMKELVPSKDWGKGKNAQFSNIEVRIPEHPEDYITDLYGSYRTYTKEEFLEEWHIIILGKNPDLKF